jgi:gamma-glutamyltranspeptidase
MRASLIDAKAVAKERNKDFQVSRRVLDMSHAMIVAPQPEAVEKGALILKNGGNAVDAAVGCALVQTVVDPQMCGLAGFKQ